MNSLNIQSSDVSPEVIFDPANKRFSISGWSRPESPSKFYGPVMQWIDTHGANHLNNATIEFNIEYFNTPSARALHEILGQLEKLYQKGVKVSVNWYFDDDNSREEFEYEFAQGLSIPIKFSQRPD